MTMTPDERQFTTKAIFAVALGVVVLGAMTSVGVSHFAKVSLITTAANSGDTPVVLVGGSMTFKSGSKKSPAWAPVTPHQEYYLTPGYDIATIVLKFIGSDDGGDNHDPDDANIHKDKLRVDISAATSWEVDAYTQSDDLHAVVQITPKQNGSGQSEIHLVRLDQAQGATLCPNGSMKRIKYGRTPDCSETLVFSKIELKVDGQSSGTINCIDDAVKKVGTCKIILRGPSS